MSVPRNVLITGCSTGIGKTTALYLDRMGFQVFAAVRRTSDMQALCDESSGRLRPVLLDVTQPESICNAEREIRAAVREAGLWGLVNNAGVAFHSSLEFASLDALRRLFDVNFFGALAVTQSFLPLVRQARGRIINISSSSVLVPTPFHAPYTCAKVALDSLSDALRLELRPFGVQVSTILAGSTDTPIWEKARDVSDEMSQRLPPEVERLYGPRIARFRAFMAAMGRRGVRPEAVARVIAQALSARRARHYYWVAVDLDMQLYYMFRDILPDALKEWIVLKAVGISTLPSQT